MLRILQLTDFHVFAEANTKLKGIPTRESLKQVVDHILQSEKPFDFVIVTGDHTHDERPESYKAVQEILAPWSDRLLQIPGNHDDRAVIRDVFTNIAGADQEQIRFAERMENWLLLGLDTHHLGEVAGVMTVEQIEWLQQQLTNTDAARIALFCHHPPVDVGSEWMDQIGLEGRELLQEVVLSEDRIRLICCGHVHHEFEGDLGVAKVLASPSTGIQFDPNGDTPQFVSAPAGYRVIQLDGLNYQTQVVRLPDVHHFVVLD